jgi:hypothetical protein
MMLKKLMPVGKTSVRNRGTPFIRERATFNDPISPMPNLGGARGNVEQNYRGVPGLVNATAPMPRPVVGFPGGPGGKTTYSSDPPPMPRPVVGFPGGPGGKTTYSSDPPVKQSAKTRTMKRPMLKDKKAY